MMLVILLTVTLLGGLALTVIVILASYAYLGES